MKKIWFLLAIFLILSLGGCNVLSPDTNNKDPEKNNQTPQNEQPIVLYYGVSLDEIDQENNIIKETDPEKKEQLYSKYEREYYLYSNNSLVGKADGKLEERGFDYYWQVTFPDELNYEYEVAISDSYNPYPRKIVNTDSNFAEEFDANGKVLNEINNKFNVNSMVKELSRIDLDDDGKDEFLALAVDKNNYFFAKCLIDSDYQIVSYLTVFKEKHDDFDELVMNYDLFNSGEIFDMDNDGIMEVLVNLPSYEGLSFKAFKYKQGSFDGDFITETSIKP